MRVAVISDIHGNVPALRAVLADIGGENVDLVVCCDDIVAGPLSSETVEILRGIGDRLRSVRGNADREVVALYDGHGSADLGSRRLLGGGDRDANAPLHMIAVNRLANGHDGPDRDRRLLSS